MSTRTDGEATHDNSPRIDGRLVVLLLALAVPQGLLAWLGAGAPLVLLGAAIFVAAAVLSYKNTFAGLILIILLQTQTLQSNIEINIVELAYSALFALTFLGWFVRDARTVEGRAVIASPVGRGIIVFFAVAVVSILPALMYGASVLWWFRDLVRFSPLVLFFPMSTVARSPRRGAGLVLAFLAVVVYFAVSALLTYDEMLSMASFASEIYWQRAPVNEVLPMAMLVAASTLFFAARRRGEFWVALSVGLVSALALAISFSRGFWVAGLMAIALSAVAMRARPGRVLGMLVILGGAALAGAYAAFGWRVFGVLASLAGRLSTVSSPLSELSVQERLAESRVVLRLVSRNPIIGYGLGTAFRYMSLTRGYYREVTFVHNGYLFLVFKLGLVGLVSYFVFYFRGVALVLRSARAAHSVWVSSVLFAAFGVMLAFLALSLTSPQFYTKDAGLFIALVLALAQAVAMSRRGSPSEVVL